MNFRKAFIAALITFIFVNLLFLGSRPVLTADETRYGSIAAQMVESGNWMSLRMSGFHFYEKPPLVYWMMALAIEIFGHNAFAIRLPAALCGGLAALAMGIAARRGAIIAGTSRNDSNTLGALVSLASITMLLPAVGATIAILDAPIAGFVIATGAALFVAATHQPGKIRMGWLVIAGIMMGFAFMTKGLLALVFPAMMIAPWLLWERRWRDLFVLPWIPLFVGALVVLPWAIAVTQTEPGFWYRFIIHEHFQRFAGTGTNQQDESWALYLLVVPLGCIPWIVAAPIAVRWWPSLARTQSGIRFAICAVIGPLLFLSASRGKLPTYSLPIFPPIAWLIVSGLLAGFKSQIPGTRIRGAFIPAAVLIMLGAGSMSLAISGDWSAELLGRVWLESPQIHAVILGAALVFWGIGDWISQRCIPGPHRVMCMGLSPVAILASLSLLFPDAIVNDLTNSGPTLMSQRDIIRSASTLMCDQRLAHACAWFLQRSDFLIVSSPREFVNGLSIPQDDARIIASADFAVVLADARSRGSVVIAAETSAVNSLMGTTGISAPTQRTDFRGWALVQFSPLSR